MSSAAFSDAFNSSTTIIVPIIQPCLNVDHMSDSDTMSEVVDMVPDDEYLTTCITPDPSVPNCALSTAQLKLKLKGLSRKERKSVQKVIRKRKLRLEGHPSCIKQVEHLMKRIRMTATQVHAHINLDDLKPGFIGAEQKVPRTDWITIPRSDNDGPNATVLIDNKGRIFAVRTTFINRNRSVDCVQGLLAAVQELEDALRQGTDFTKLDSDNSITFGLSYETGQTEPSQLERKVDAVRLQSYKANISVQACVRHVRNIVRTWFPRILGYCEEEMSALEKRHCHLQPPFPGLPFMASAINVEPQNPAFGLCVFTILGNFGHKKTSKFRMEEVGVELEIAHGDIVICPAWMTCYNTAIASHETRRSVAFYTIRQNGSRPVDSLMSEEEWDMYLNVKEIGQKTEASHNLETTT